LPPRSSSLPAAIDSFPGEYPFNGEQITRAGLEDHFCGKLMGVPMDENLT